MSSFFYALFLIFLFLQNNNISAPMIDESFHDSYKKSFDGRSLCHLFRICIATLGSVVSATLGSVVS